MNPVSIPAHFDGERILLDEPIELEPETRLIVTILPREDEERDAWLRASAGNLADAYDGEGDEYGFESIKELNPEYEGK